MQPGTNQQDVLINFDHALVRAETGKRFLNYILDVILFYVLVVGLAIIAGMVSPAVAEWLMDDSSQFNLVEQVVMLLLYAVYMFVVEAVFKGKSLGKLITRTRAVNPDGSRISTAKALSRGFSRAVPFSAFSALGSPCNPWQDKWTDTIVIDEKRSQWNGLPTD